MKTQNFHVGWNTRCTEVSATSTLFSPSLKKRRVQSIHIRLDNPDNKNLCIGMDRKEAIDFINKLKKALI